MHTENANSEIAIVKGMCKYTLHNEIMVTIEKKLIIQFHFGTDIKPKAKNMLCEPLH